MTMGDDSAPRERPISWEPATDFMVSPKLLLFCFPSPFYIPVIHQLQQLETFSFSFVFWRVMGSSSCPLMDVYMDLVLLPILNSLLLVCWPGRLFLVANFGRIRFSPPAVSAGTGRGAISSQVRGRWQRHMAVNSRIECLDDDSRWLSLECLGCLCQLVRLFCYSA